MLKPELPADEATRLATLQLYQILDTPPERAFDDLVRIASTICRTDMAAVSLIDRDRQWFKASKGLAVSETGRDVAFCAHAILDPQQLFVIENATLDPRFHDNPLVTGDPNIRFYAGAPLLGLGGQPLGTLCVLDDEPAHLDDEQRQALEALSRQAAQLLEPHRVSHALQQQLREREWYENQLAQYSVSLEQLNADLTEQTRTDPLTGLPNRRAFSAALNAAIAQCGERGTPVALAMVDIDHFKTINDMHGHDVGDEVLVALSALLRAHVAGRGRVARLGGEEFVLLLPDCDIERARLQCEFLREEVALLPINLPLTVSIGVTALRVGESPEIGLRRADQALYAAKHAGRNRVVVD